MKIHDKYVIELAEIIKGFGNDPSTKDPLNLPCDYKFYEIEGVAICENSFKKMKPFGGEVWDILDYIDGELGEFIEPLPEGAGEYERGYLDAMKKASEIVTASMRRYWQID